MRMRSPQSELQTCSFFFFREALSRSLHYACESQMLWRGCALAQARLSIRWSPAFILSSCDGSICAEKFLSLYWVRKSALGLSAKSCSGLATLKEKAGSLTFTTLWANSAGDKMMFFLIVYRKIGFDTSCKLSPKGKTCMSYKLETTCMKCQSLFSGEKKKKETYFCWNMDSEW